MFRRIDLKSVIYKTPFYITFGLYEYLMMPFAPTTFNSMMSQIFHPHRDFTGTFFDHIIVLSKMEEGHKKQLAIMFQEVCNQKIYENGKSF